MRNPFSEALRTALTASGYSLEQLSAELRRRGTPVSVSALSNWQTGENHPERASSIAAVSTVEAVLGVPARSLVTLIPPRRSRGRRRTVPGLPHQRLWRSPEVVTRLLAKLDADPAELTAPARISRTEKARIDEWGHERGSHTRLLLQGNRDRTERLFVVTRCHSLPQAPTVYGTEGCRPGRFRADATASLYAFELLLDRPLAAGELTAVEYGLRLPPGQPETRSTVRVHPGLRDLTLRIDFHPGRMPVRCHGFHQPAYDQPEQPTLRRGGDELARGFQLVLLDPAPGIHGVRWEWPEP
ncbi:MAG: helix-turn-helix domain-containing protein [Micromonosporaceae bacterium]